MKEKINKILFPFNVLMTAFGFINFGKDLLPGLVKWSEFILMFLEFFKKIRDFILFPLTGFISLFHIELLEWFKSYLFIGLLTFNTYNFSYKVICGHLSNSSILRLVFGPDRIKTLFSILYTFLLWPIHLLSLAKHYYDKGYERKHNVYTLWGKYIFWVFFTVIGIVFINWTFKTFLDELFAN